MDLPAIYFLNNRLGRVTFKRVPYSPVAKSIIPEILARPQKLITKLKMTCHLHKIFKSEN